LCSTLDGSGYCAGSLRKTCHGSRRRDQPVANSVPNTQPHWLGFASLCGCSAGLQASRDSLRSSRFGANPCLPATQVTQHQQFMRGLRGSGRAICATAGRQHNYSERHALLVIILDEQKIQLSIAVSSRQQFVAVHAVAHRGPRGITRRRQSRRLASGNRTDSMRAFVNFSSPRPSGWTR
jgi:hypothetical protein